MSNFNFETESRSKQFSNLNNNWSYWISIWNTYLSAEFPKVFKEHGSARIINGFETNGPLPYQLQLVVKIPPAFNHLGVLI